MVTKVQMGGLSLTGLRGVALNNSVQDNTCNKALLYFLKAKRLGERAILSGDRKEGEVLLLREMLHLNFILLLLGRFKGLIAKRWDMSISM